MDASQKALGDEPGSRMKEDLCVPLHTLVELLVCVWSLVERYIVRNNKGWLSASRYDQVTEVAIVRLSSNHTTIMIFGLSVRRMNSTHFDVTLACTYRETFLEQFACVRVLRRTVSHKKRWIISGPNGNEIYPLNRAVISRSTPQESACLLRRSRIGSARVLRNIKPRDA